jgi:hypothetical protein
MPGELVAAERIHEAVAGYLPRLVQRERVQPLALVGHLPSPARALGDPELARELLALRLAVDDQRLPERHAGTLAEHHRAVLLLVPVQRASSGVDPERFPRR